jgi:DNA-binding NarL/FixJ family response regulator
VHKILVFISCCNRLLGESIAHILTKRPDFQVSNALPWDHYVDGSCGKTNVVVFDSLQVLNTYKTKFFPTPLESVDIRSVLIAMQDNREQFLRAIRSGVSGYVLQDASAIDVISAVRAVAQGEAVCPARMTRALFDYVAKHSTRSQAPSRSSEKTLTRRELELVPLIGNGLTNKEIAARLNLSEETIKSHIHRILRKVGVEDRRAVFEAWQTNGLEIWPSMSKPESGEIPSGRVNFDSPANLTRWRPAR